MKKFLNLFLTVLAITLVAGIILAIPSAKAISSNVLNVNEDEGMTFDGLSLYQTAKDNLVKEKPVTYEAYIKLPAMYSADAGTIYGNYKSASLAGVRFRIREDGNPHLYYTYGGKTLSINFKEVNVATGDYAHLAIVDDIALGEIRCYLNGNLAQTVALTSAQKTFTRQVDGMPMCIGGDFIAGTNNFKGNIRSVAIYKDVRSEQEIKADMLSVDLSDTNLISYYDLSGKQGQAVIEDQKGSYDVINNRMTSDWARPEELPEVDDFAYSIALLGDTQIVTGYYPDEFHHIIDWLLENKDEHKIAHVLNMGDMTNFNHDEEWDLVKEQYFRLNGKLDYTLVRGDHDLLDDDVDNNGDDTTKYDRWFEVPEYLDRFGVSGGEDGADYYTGENGSITNSYRAIEINGNKYLIVTMDKYPSEDVLNWLDAAIKRYPTHRVIMTMHCFITDKGEYIKSRNNANELIGIDIWNRIKGYSNLEMVICGHEYAYGVVWTKDKGTNGNVINQILANPQGPDFDREGATGMIAMLYFSEDGTDVQVRYYSPIIDRYFVGNNNNVNNAATGTKYLLETSVFKMDTDTFSPATQITDLKKVEYVQSSTEIKAEANGSLVSVSYTTDKPEGMANGKISLRYDSSLLSNPQYTWNITAQNTDVISGDGVLIFKWENATDVNVSSKELFSVSFTSGVTATSPAGIRIETNNLSYKSGDTTYVLEGIENKGTIVKAGDAIVTYNATLGDSFKEKVEYALKFADIQDVTLVMETDFSATESITIGDIKNVPKYRVNIVSSDSSNPVSIVTNGYNIIFAGKYNFDYLVLTGNGTGASNSLFFPNGSSVVFGSNLTAGSKTLNVTGADIEINSGSYYYVGALIDDTIGMTVIDAQITLKGNSVANTLTGGSRLSGNVEGTSTVKLLDSAKVTNYASASGYASNSLHNGYLYVNTTETVNRLCAAIGPVGSSKVTPTYKVDIDNVKCTTDCGFMGIRVIGNKKNSYANTIININDGEFSKDCFGGLYVSSSYYTAACYGTNTVNINGGTFTATVFGGAYFAGKNSIQASNTVLNITSGKLSAPVYGGSNFAAVGCKHNGTSELNFIGGSVTANVYGGSLFDEYATAADGSEAQYSIHKGVTTLNIDGTTSFTKYIYGGSMLSEKYTKHTGNTITEIKAGTFSSGTQLFGSSTLQETYTEHKGDSTLNIYGGVTLNNYVAGGAQLWKNGTGYATEGGNGVLMSGNITFNIYNVDKNGNPATVTLNGGRLYASSYGNSSYDYAEQTGNTTFNYNGIALPATAFGGLRAQGKYTRMSGKITGTLENINVSGTFGGGSEIVGANASDTGDITLTLKNVNVTGTVYGGSKLTKNTQKYEGKSTVNYESGTVSGSVAGGCYFTVPNVKINGSSELKFGTTKTTPIVSAGGKLIGGSMADSAVFTTAGTTSEWGMYGSSDLKIENGTVSADGYLVGGSFLYADVTNSTSVNWDKYPVVGGVPGENNTNHTKLTINGGTVNGPKIYAGSYCANGGQDHGKVILEINGGTVIVTTAGIENYTSTSTYASIANKCIYPATFYPVNTKEITCDYTLTLNGGYFDTVSDKAIGFAVFHGYDGVINGNTELNIAITTQNGKANTKYRINSVVGGIMEAQANAVLKGNSTLNIYNSDSSTPYMYPGVPITAGCYTTYSSGKGKADADANDGIKFGFTQIGNVNFNMSAGTINRTVMISGFGSNLDGNVNVNISGGTIMKDVHGAGDNDARYYSSVTGDIVWNISKVTLNSGVNLFGGADAKSSVTSAEGYNVVKGNIYMEISGGTFNGNLSVAGNNSITTGKEVRIKFVGNGFTLGTKVLPHGTVCSSYNGTYTIDLFHATKDVDTSGFANANVISPFNSGSVIELENVEVGPNDKANVLVNGKNVVIDGKTYKYDYLTAFDEYTENDNGFVFFDVDENGTFGEKIENITPYPSHNIYVKVGDKSSAIIELDHVFKLKNKSLSLASSLTMNLKVLPSVIDVHNYTDVKMVVTFGGEEYVLNTYEFEDFGEGNENNRYYFEFKGIAPQGMVDKMTITLKANYNEKEVVAETVEYSVKEYCMNLLDKNISDELNTLLVDLLNYGTAAQIYGRYNVENLANADLSEEQVSYGTQSLRELVSIKDKAYETIEDATATIVPGLSLGNAITIRYKITLDSGVDTSNLKLVITNVTKGLGEEVEFADFEFISGNSYYVYFSGLNADQVSDHVTAVVYSGDVAISNTYLYSVESYAQKYTDSVYGLVADLVSGLVKYSDSAIEYAKTIA